MYDIVIVGSGGAALSCAITLKENGHKVLIVSKVSNTSSQTTQAQGGINAAINPLDSVNNHISDTLKSAKNIGNENVISFMCKSAASTIKWLDELGVPFSRDESNNISQRKLGGTSFNRACYSSDYTGLKILQSLFDKAISLNIDFIEDNFLLNIIQENNEAKGITAYDIKSGVVKQYLAKAVILASGGFGGVFHNYSTN